MDSAYPTAPNTPLTFKVTFPAMRVSLTNIEKTFRPIGFLETDIVGYINDISFAICQSLVETLPMNCICVIVYFAFEVNG